MRYILIICLLLAGCKSAEKIADEKRAKQAQQIDEEMRMLKKMRAMFPCDTTSQVDTLIELHFVKGDTVYSPGGVKVVHDTIQRTITKTIKVIDEGHLQALRDSVTHIGYLYDLAAQAAAEQAKRADKAETQLTEAKKDKGYWQRASIITWVAMGVVGGAGIALKFIKL